ncbi:Ankyrin-repeat protein [Orpheovirus IHUMI-LCC2]|uniref:Ankyrin-repeat protein n=1 Tax=Orpheovirus IHUMI-LCC2 TaxID=2023057 RepID=A0A2I2L491_9VIRU|nr:Ankyrin-repeat protein [Orpheovirus IHUMI-LCC2]SNW62356.1 Ankyrin-repeat protein [Orpheovirus IHUMI-LCC2]
MVTPITSDVFDYLIESFLSKEEKTILRLVNKKYRNKYNNYVNIKTLIKNENINTFALLIIEAPTNIHVLCGLLEHGDTHLLSWFKDTYKNIIYNNFKLFEDNKFINLYESAVKSGKVEVLEWVKKNIIIRSEHYGLAEALHRESLDVIKWCYEHARPNFIFLSDDIPNMIRERRKFTLEIFQWYYKLVSLHWINLSDKIFYTTDIVKWLIHIDELKDCTFWTAYNIFNCALEDGNIELLELLKEERLISRDAILENIIEFEPFETATRCGNLQSMKWLYKNEYKWDIDIIFTILNLCDKIGEENVIEIMKWINDHILINMEERDRLLCPSMYSCCDNNIKLAEYLIEIGCPAPMSCYNDKDCTLLIKTSTELYYNPSRIQCTIHDLCQHGDVDRLKWLINSYEYDIVDIEKTFINDVIDTELIWDNNFLSIINDTSYIRSHFLVSACESGNLELIKFLYGIGCEYIPQCSFILAEKGYIHILEWMKQNGLRIVFNEEWKRGKYVSKRGYDWLVANKYI